MWTAEYDQDNVNYISDKVFVGQFYDNKIDIPLNSLKKIRTDESDDSEVIPSTDI